MILKQLLNFLLLFFPIVSVFAQKDYTEMVRIPAGEFLMGKNTLMDVDYKPAHKVKVEAFLMDKHEVTNLQYLAFCRMTGHELPEFWNTEIFRSGDKFLNYPVVGISWNDAVQYAAWAGKRLPTEAEWEYAARGGLVENDYPNGNYWTKIKPIQNGESWNNLIEPVKSHEPNGYGLYDMGGNVWEWVVDFYSKNYYSESGTHNPKGPKRGSHRVIRGGSWHSGAMCKKVYYRKALPASWCDFAVGFRCVQDIVE